MNLLIPFFYTFHPNFKHEYFESYADHFNLKDHIKFKHKVIKAEQSVEKTGQWRVTALDLTTNKEVTTIFDGILVCTGHHVKPLVPTFKGQEKFKGKDKQKSHNPFNLIVNRYHLNYRENNSFSFLQKTTAF